MEFPGALRSTFFSRKTSIFIEVVIQRRLCVVRVSVCLFVHLFVCPFVHLSIFFCRLCVFRLIDCPSGRSAYPPICLCVCSRLFICVSLLLFGTSVSVRLCMRAFGFCLSGFRLFVRSLICPLVRIPSGHLSVEPFGPPSRLSYLCVCVPLCAFPWPSGRPRPTFSLLPSLLPFLLPSIPPFRRTSLPPSLRLPPLRFICSFVHPFEHPFVACFHPFFSYVFQISLPIMSKKKLRISPCRGSSFS